MSLSTNIEIDSFSFQIFRFAMSNQADADIAREEERATQDTANENIRELRKEYGEDVDTSDDEVVRPTVKSQPPPVNSTNHPNENVQKKDSPQMNSQLQH